MVAKCLNPKCSTRFRYLHEGRLFCLAHDRRQGEQKTNGGHAEMEYVWICHACSLVFEPGRDGGGEIILKPLMRGAAEDVGLKREARHD